jgi:hypothetical protein
MEGGSFTRLRAVIAWKCDSDLKMAQDETNYPTLYHITFQEDWEKAKTAGVYTADSLQQVRALGR